MSAGASLSGVVKRYGEAVAVDGVDLDVAPGDFLCLLGPSGCGKTTVLRMIAGLEAPSAGRIAIGGRVMADPEAGAFVPAEGRDLGLVFQNYALWPHLTVRRNVDFGLRLRGAPPATRDAEAEAAMRLLGVAELAGRYPSQLSGGQQQRVAIARTLAVRPRMLLLDEPLSNLDARLRLEMRAELKRLHAATGATVIFVTHDQWEAMTLASTIAVMRAGRIEQVGPPEAIYDRPATRFVAEFVGAPPINMAALDGPSALAAAMRPHAPEATAEIGLRPEALRLGPGPVALQARVEGVLPTGGAWIVELGCAGGPLFHLAHQRPDAAAGAMVPVSFDPAAAHCFDASGRRLPAPVPHPPHTEMLHAT
ncbi:ABC transporter ATP-binding protein [Rubrimonas sp.]|uniref:ABC transporter ATP-binding protein n=1 Tax=Rubrimonas sp. TaxID=2036015 RepID=UPI002FDCDF67